MERYSRKIQDKDTSLALEFIFQNAFGNPILFSSAPSSEDLKANTWGKHSTNLYIKFADGTTLRFSGTSIA